MRRPKTIKILVTGGHLTPALAAIEEIKRARLPWEIVFVGRKFAMEGDKSPSSEYRIITQRRLRFLPLTAGRLQRVFTAYTLLSLLKFPLGLGQALWYCMSESPQCVLSFGGYVALPVVLAAWSLGIPVITHEQTRVPGLANRVIGRLARRVCVSFAQAADGFPKDKVSVTGPPLRRGLFTAPAKLPFEIANKVPLLYITGGSTGAQVINESVYPAVNQLTKNYAIIHQTGYHSYPRAQEWRARLSPDVRARYQVFPFLDIDLLGGVLLHAALVVGRSGANTVWELAALGKPAIFIPLPWSAGKEQYGNAQLFEQAGAGVILDQADLNPESLEEAINRVMRDLGTYQRQARQLANSTPHDGAQRLVAQVTNMLEFR